LSVNACCSGRTPGCLLNVRFASLSKGSLFSNSHTNPCWRLPRLRCHQQNAYAFSFILYLFSKREPAPFTSTAKGCEAESDACSSLLNDFQHTIYQCLVAVKATWQLGCFASFWRSSKDAGSCKKALGEGGKQCGSIGCCSSNR
jgi:hypothetical protein